MIEGDDTPLGDASGALLSGLRRSWRTLSGVISSREDEVLLEEGRKAWHAAHSNEGQALDDVSGSAGPAIETHYRFFAATNPWRLRLERIEAAPSAAGWYDLLILNGASWWSKHGPVVITNEGNPEYEIGTLDLSVLLRPSGLLRGYEFVQTQRLSREGRDYVRLNARALGELGRLAPQLVVLGADVYELLIDLGLGVIVRWEAMIGGHVARRDELSELSDRKPVSDSLFVPPVGRLDPPG